MREIWPCWSLKAVGIRDLNPCAATQGELAFSLQQGKHRGSLERELLNSQI
jgi:hypothetical protein